MFDRYSIKSNEVKIFTYYEFITEINKYWDLIIKPEFPNEKKYKIIFKGKNDSTCYCACENRLLKFGKEYLVGVYKLWYVIDTIKHELGHVLDYMRNGSETRIRITKTGRTFYDLHGKYFKEIADQFNFCDVSAYTQIRLKSMKVYAGS